MDRILFVEDNERLAKELAVSLKLSGFEVVVAGTLAEAEKKFSSQAFDLLLLDVNLPDGTGFEWCRELRKRGTSLPILFLTAKADEESVVEGLTLGANDYLRKPFGSRELVARIRLQLSRSGKPGKQTEYGGVVIDMAEKRAQYQSKALELTSREFQVLTELVRRGGNLLTRDQCLAEIDEEAEMSGRALDTLVSRLRKKLKEAGASHLEIQSEYGEGYRLANLKKSA